MKKRVAWNEMMGFLRKTKSIDNKDFVVNFIEKVGCVHMTMASYRL
jgi:hypothetical protein